jgi:hypothetical protein
MFGIDTDDTFDVCRPVYFMIAILLSLVFFGLLSAAVPKLYAADLPPDCQFREWHDTSLSIHNFLRIFTAV